jgi:hypothetical protein
MPCTQVVADYEKTLRDVISKARKLAATAAAMLLAGAPPQVFRTEFVERRLPSVSHHVDHAPPASTVPLILFNPLPAPRCALVAMSRACAQDGAVECADASVLDDLGREIPSARLAEPSDVAKLVQIRNEGRNGAMLSTDPSEVQVAFRACVPGLGLATYFVSPARAAASVATTTTTASSRSSSAAAAQPSVAGRLPPMEVWGGSVAGPSRPVLHGGCTDVHLDGSSGLMRELSFGCAGEPKLADCLPHCMLMASLIACR